jgi:hypothetical protein
MLGRNCTESKSNTSILAAIEENRFRRFSAGRRRSSSPGQTHLKFPLVLCWSDGGYPAIGSRVGAKIPAREAPPEMAMEARFFPCSFFVVSVCFGMHLIQGKTGTYWLILVVQ